MTPQRLGRYELIRVLGKGAMGVVYEGRDPNLERRVAIKTVRIENLSAEEVIEYDARFRTEARSAARLQHPNIVSVYDSDRDGDVAFLVMEFIEGEDLKHHLDQGLRYSLAESLRIIGDLLSALDYSHRQGIVHRDIKPANLLIEPAGRVKLTDFGVARMQDSGEATRTQGGMVGTLKYMSPEQVQGHKVDQRSDLFSAGVVLYQLLTDVRPFDGDTEYAIIHRILEEELTPPSSLNRALPFAVDAVVARALAKDRERRFQSAQDFSLALHAAVQSSYDTTAVPPLNPRRRRGDADPAPGAQGMSGSSGVATNSVTSSSGSTITQELELVYWKDVRESDDAHELEVFLRKFPMGLYADLARRRLRILRESFSPSNAGRSVPGQGESGPWTQTQAYSRTTPDDAPAAAAEAGQPDASAELPSAAMPARADAPASTAVHEASLSGTIESGGQPPPTDPPALASAGAQGPKVQRSRKPFPRTAAIVAVALLAALAGAMALMSGRSAAPDPVALPAQPALPGASAVAEPLVPTAAVPATVTAERDAVRASAGATARVAAASAASAPRVAGSAVASGRRQAASSTVAGAAASAPALASSAPASRPVSRASAPVPETPVPAALAIDPGEACKGRMLLGLETCLREQCETAASRDHPVCKQRREWDSWRKDSERARSNQGG